MSVRYNLKNMHPEVMDSRIRDIIYTLERLASFQSQCPVEKRPVVAEQTYAHYVRIIRQYHTWSELQRATFVMLCLVHFDDVMIMVKQQTDPTMYLNLFEIDRSVNYYESVRWMLEGSEDRPALRCEDWARYWFGLMAAWSPDISAFINPPYHEVSVPVLYEADNRKITYAASGRINAYETVYVGEQAGNQLRKKGFMTVTSKRQAFDRLTHK